MSELAYSVAGPAGAPALLLGPSLGTTTDVWAAQVPELARDRRVVRFDLPGHGGSPPSGPVTIASLAAGVSRIADELGLESLDYAGVSIGGMIGIALAGIEPRLRRLALVCTSAYLPPASGWLDRASLVRLSGPGAVVDMVVARWFTPPFSEAHPDLVAGFKDSFRRLDAEGYAACCEAIAAMDLRGATVAVPTLVIAGRDDPAIPPSHGEAIARTVPGARFVVLDNAAHLANVERAAEVTALMTGFLEAP
jgi:3-oxoadipate enol-lactonase